MPLIWALIFRYGRNVYRAAQTGHARSTEEIIGTWFKKTGKRDEIILATKVSGRALALTGCAMTAQKTQHSPEQIMEAIDKSLGRLQTDYVDLYQLHWPDRPMAVFGGGFGYNI